MVNLVPTSAFLPQEAAPPLMGAQRPSPRGSAAIDVVPNIPPKNNDNATIKSFFFITPSFIIGFY